MQTSLLNTPAQWLTKVGGSEFRVMRMNDAPAFDRTLDNPAAMVEYLRPRLKESIIFRPDVENFIVIHLNTRLRPIGFEITTQGTLDTLLVHSREVFRGAIVANSACIVLAHNHPSQDSTPSTADIKVTRDLVRAGQLLKIDVKDHIVLGQPSATNSDGYTSLKALGYFTDFS